MTRLIDLHVPWLRQYAGETTLFEPTDYPRTAQRVGQVAGYLQGTSAAVLSVGRTAGDWAKQADPWAALGDLIARVEAEFCGRLLYGPEDVARWRAAVAGGGLCWGLIGIDGGAGLIRTASDLDRLPSLYRRGARLFQMTSGAAPEGNRAFLQTLFELGAGPARPLCDLAGLSLNAAADVLTWFEADTERSRRVIPISSHGAMDRDNARRLRDLGGVIGLGVGPPDYTTTDALKADFDALAAGSSQGLAIGTAFLAQDDTLPGLDNVPAVVRWITSNFDAPTAAAIVHANAERVLCRALGASE